MTILIREGEVEQLLPMPQAIELVEQALRAYGNGEAENRPRQRVRGDVGILNVMPAALRGQGYMGFKAYTATRGGARFYFHLYSTHSGEYLALIEADRLGQIRTGAASGVATKYLARPEARTVGIYGTGWQAGSQLTAICAVRPVRAVHCFSRDAVHRHAFADKMSRALNVSVQPVDRAEDAALASDILITITSSATPVLLGDWLAPGVHINAAGSNWPQRREIDARVVAQSSAIFVDSIEQARAESGALIMAADEGQLDWTRVRELGSLLAGRSDGRQAAEDITLFKSHGIALEDVAVAGWVYEQACAAGIGQALPL